jgi:hypothetical protein
MASNGCPNQGFPQYQIKVNVWDRGIAIKVSFLVRYSRELKVIIWAIAM